MEAVNLTSARRLSWLFYGLVAIAVLLVLAAIGTPNLLRSRMASPQTDFARTEQTRLFLGSAIATRAGHASEKIQLAAAPGIVEAATDLDRKVLRKGTLDLIVGSPSSTFDDVGAIARRHGGYVVSSELTGKQENQHGTITIRVPAAQFDAAREQLKKLAKRVESEQTSADDITMQYSENEATVRNFRAEEASYLEIMKRTGAIKDTLQVAQQLSDVRGRIERLEAQIRTMSMESEMSAIQVTVSAEPIAVAVQHWRPLYELRAAWNEGVDALTTYATAMIAILMYLPATLLWVMTIACVVKLGRMLFRFAARWLSTSKEQITTA